MKPLALHSCSLRGLAGCLVLGVALLTSLRAAPETVSPVPEPEVTGEFWLGEEFVRLGRVEEGGFETEDYLPRGETLATWRQRVTVRRSTQAGRLDPRLFLAGFRAELGKDPSLHLEDGGAAMGGRLLLVNRVAGAEGTRFRSCVLILHSREAGLVLIQYSQQPDRLDESLGDMQLAAWRERLQGLLAAKNASSPNSVPAPSVNSENHG